MRDDPAAVNVEIIGPNEVSGVCTPQPIAPTKSQYGAFDHAYDRFNHELFGDRLPRCLITLQRRSKTLGYFAANKFAPMNGGDEAQVDELALNPAHFRTRGPRDVLSTLAHEMCHVAVQHFGKPVRAGYHDYQWANLMKRIGLQPTDTGAPGGRETGYKMSHVIVEDGPFALAYDELIRTTTIGWGDALAPEADKLAKPPKRLKFVCPACSFNALAVPSAAGRLACIPCGNIVMVAP